MGSEHFSDAELACHHCGCLPDGGIDDNLLGLLEDMRSEVGGPLTLSCAYRCQKHNDELPGSVPNSQHVLGKAADVIVPDGMSVDELADIAVACGADGVGRYYSSGFVHVDVRAGRSSYGAAWEG